jgi:hypothetical protein
MVYGDLGVFGTSAMSVLETDDGEMNTGVLPVGSYWVSTNDEGEVDTLIRECRMTVRQVVGRFGLEKVSSRTKSLWDSGDHEVPVDVLHAVYPNEEHDPKALDSRYKEYASCYYEIGDNTNMLSQAGYDEFPVLVPRWDLTGNDVYGSSPGMDALGDVRALQILEKRKAQAVEKTVNPPMTAPSSLRNQKASILPGDITYVDIRDGQDGFKPAHEIRFSIKEMVLDIENHERRISRAFYEDLFLMFAMTDRREITAREIQERHEEKLLALGPVIGRLNSDLLDPLIDRTFEIMWRTGRIPPPPPELESGMDLKVEYISMMAQAQKLVSLGSTERFATFATNLSNVVPDIMDKVDFDEIVEEHGNMMGVPPRFLRAPEVVNQIRADRQARIRAQEQAAHAEQMSKAARNLSGTEVNKDNALTRIGDAVASGL